MNNSDVFRPGFTKASSRAMGFMRIFMMLVGLLCSGVLVFAVADTHYVSLDGDNTSPYTNGWASA
ncbi:MAG: hypothetical protein L6437_00905, partial [Kiritimatiellae bacterium]|nr:hypothetical protein [Kiritimatiellia bacterium]